MLFFSKKSVVVAVVCGKKMRSICLNFNNIEIKFGEKSCLVVLALGGPDFLSFSYSSKIKIRRPDY